MRRILVTGNAGAGKTTLAGRIAEDLALPCHSLDRIVWQAGWKKRPRGERTAAIRDLVAGDSWVIDGVSPMVEAAADLVVFLDVSRARAYWQTSKRNWRYLFQSRPDLPPGCPEILIVPTLWRIIWQFPAAVRPGILERMKGDPDPKRYRHLRSRREAEVFLRELRDGEFSAPAPAG